MKRNDWFFRLFFTGICCFTASAYEISLAENSTSVPLLKGCLIGACLSGIIFAAEKILRQYTLRTISTAFTGLLIGTIMAEIVTFSIGHLLHTVAPSTALSELVQLLTFLSCIYVGIILTATSSESWWLSIPFVRLAPTGHGQKKEILVDASALEDTRLLELARSGLLDHCITIPTFVIKEIQKSIESHDEAIRTRARRCYEHFKRLESMENLGLQVKEFHFSDADEIGYKMVQAAKLLQAYIITAQDAPLLKTEDDDTHIISLDSIAGTLKPGAQRGELLQIRVQRLGKEPKQGVGYLEDGTMVVVNGGGEFLGQTIRTQVLSQKYSSSGKIIFCNAIHDDAIALDKIRIPLAETVAPI